MTASARVSAMILIALLVSCSRQNHVNPRLSNEMPQKMIWAWERPEDLRFLDPKEFGVAFLAQTIFLEKDNVSPRPRRQPLEVAPRAYLIAVTRIETKKGDERPSFSAEMAAKTAALMKSTLELPDVKGLQVDFDAVVSERAFYRSLMNELRRLLSEPPASAGGQKVNTMPTLTMTSLASWCTGDAWFNDFPVDEAVPMAFQMGADDEKIKTYLRNGNDWKEPLCRGSYGLSANEPPLTGLKTGRRFYYFNKESWRPSDIAELQH